MNAVFVILFIISLLFLVIGAIKPGINKKTGKPYKRKDLIIGFGIFVIVFAVLAGVTAPPISPVSATTKLAPNATKQTPSKTVKATSTTQTKTVVQTKPVPFSTTTVQDANLASGTTKVTTVGANGVETLTYQDTYTNGRQTAQKLVSEVVTTKPVTQVTTVGTYVAPAAPTTPPPAAPTTQGCTPLTDGGNCYEPGEYCRDSDHSSSGVAGDGERITCIDNNGWRWEPS